MVREKKIYQLSEDISTADRFAVFGNADKFLNHKHAWKVWRVLKEFGCTVYPVAQNLARIEGSKVFPDLLSLKDKIDVVIPCLPPEQLSTLIAETLASGVRKIWFQTQTWTPEIHGKCQLEGIRDIKGCVLSHKKFSLPSGYFNPCYWHGLRNVKVPGRKRV